jgi:hypothetical protein
VSVSSRAAVDVTSASCHVSMPIGRPNLTTTSPRLNFGSTWPVGWILSVPSTPTGMIGTPAARASRATPVRPR